LLLIDQVRLLAVWQGFVQGFDQQQQEFEGQAH
jgi:hypothetical protein